MYHSGISSSTLNSIRSSLSFFCESHLNLGQDPIILRLFRAFYKANPPKPKYMVYWKVETVLDLLSSWHPARSLSLKMLTLKTLGLIALSSSDRGQTIHSLDIENTHIDKDGISFLIYKRLKTSKRNFKPKVVKCISTDYDALNVCDYTLSYLNRTLTLRASHVDKGFPKPTQLFLSWHTKKPVTKNTLARWLTMILNMAGINTKQFQAHSFRGAGLSSALRRGASLSQIIEAGDWTNTNTFNNYYNAPTDTSAVGKIILQHEVWLKICNLDTNTTSVYNLFLLMS